MRFNEALMFIASFSMGCQSALGRQARTPAEPQSYFTEPAIFPDRSEIAFVSGGEIWTVPATGGDARLLVSNPASESRPIYSQDGKQLAVISNRTVGIPRFRGSFLAAQRTSKKAITVWNAALTGCTGQTAQSRCRW
jgi:hypothetical protein